MSQLVLVGMNHKTAPIEIRERLAAVCREDKHLLHRFPQLRYVDELFVLSTCNRVEILFVCNQLHEATHEVKSLLRGHLGDALSAQVESCFYTYQFLDAVKHLFRVASSLDSMVVGEPQILGQIKAAYREATECKAVGVILNRLLHKAFSVAKRVRSETMIGSHAVSISYAAVELARKIFRDLRDKRVLLIGAGEMAELAAEHLLAQGVRQLMVANRTLERAVELAGRFKGETVSFSHILDALKNVDIVLTSTGSPEPILRHKDVKSRMRERKNRPLFFIDIAVPRDVEQRVNEIENVYLYDIDDLQGIVDFNRAGRQLEAERAEHIVAEETVKFQQWLCTLDVVPTIVGLREKADAIRRQELLRTLSHLPHLTEKDRKAIDVLTQSIVKKLLHDPIMFLKKKAHRGSKQLFTDCTQQLFNLTNGCKPDSSALTDEVSSVKNENKILKNLEK
ncbi:MAG TPA: glutamyl-tRNA reductase [Syntrophobacteraceae bacterium]|nr:glutamyl-tRNA reductase [Syntrophobacteraceae bacterium]